MLDSDQGPKCHCCGLKCLTIRLLNMFYQHHCFCHFNYWARMFAIIYSFRNPVAVKLSYFSFNFSYGHWTKANCKAKMKELPES